MPRGRVQSGRFLSAAFGLLHVIPGRPSSTGIKAYTKGNPRQVPKEAYSASTNSRSARNDMQQAKGKPQIVISLIPPCSAAPPSGVCFQTRDRTYAVPQWTGNAVGSAWLPSVVRRSPHSPRISPHMLFQLLRRAALPLAFLLVRLDRCYRTEGTAFNAEEIVRSLRGDFCRRNRSAIYRRYLSGECSNHKYGTDECEEVWPPLPGGITTRTDSQTSISEREA